MNSVLQVWGSQYFKGFKHKSDSVFDLGVVFSKGICRAAVRAAELGFRSPRASVALPDSLPRASLQLLGSLPLPPLSAQPLCNADLIQRWCGHR